MFPGSSQRLVALWDKTVKRTFPSLVLLNGRRADVPRCILSYKVLAMHYLYPMD